jgi:antitoxin component of RelBE/YafQ-DinJ toxin-antitoxin module
MAKNQKSVTITIKLDERVKILLEKSSHEMGLSLSQYARNIIYCALDDYKILKNLKLIKLESFNIYLNPKDSHLKIQDTEQTKDVNISVIIREDVKHKLQEIADDLGLTLKQVARNFIYVGLYEHDIFKKLGLLRLGTSAKGFIASLISIFGAHDK